MIRIVLIEDERLIAEEMRSRLLALSNDIEITATLMTVEESVSYFTRNAHPDLILSDIQLPDGLSFDIFSDGALAWHHIGRSFRHRPRSDIEGARHFTRRYLQVSAAWG